MSHYYYQLPQPEEVEDSIYTTGSLRHPNRRNRHLPHYHQQQHADNHPYRPRSSTDSIPFVDADSSGHARAGSLSQDAGTSSSEETVNRHPHHTHINNPRALSAGSTPHRRRQRYPPPPPSPPATFLDSEDATSLNNLLDALEDLDVVEEDRRSSLATTGSSRDDEVVGDEEPAVVNNGPPRPTLASILVSIPPPPTPPPPESEMDVQQLHELELHQKYHQQRQQQEQQKQRQLQKQPARRMNPTSATNHSNHTVSFVLPPPPPPPPKEELQLKV
ncbi:lysine-specific demethylase 9-like [Periplaneta americana]|uniref:lysine-specific demethylase 9-like n=1 Tax=Periplaneta americana TaxID=6978 RepID=UPI0037E7CFA1